MNNGSATQQFSGWRERASFLAPSHITSKVGGEEHEFYRLSVNTATRLFFLCEGAAVAIGALFVDTSNDYGSTSRNVTDDNSGAMQMETIVEPIDPRLAELRAKQREDSIRKLFHSVVNDKNKEVLAEAIMDSMRGLFPDKASRPPIKEFLDEVPMPAFIDMLIGVSKANKGVLGPLAPLGEMIGDLLKQLVESGVEKATSQMKEAQTQFAPKQTQEETSEVSG